MYYGHLNHKQFENRPDFSHYNYRYHGTEGGFIPMIIFAMILAVVVVASFVSYKSTERVAPDGSHIHWTWFGKQMIYEDGQHRSHHFMHPKTCPICKEILYKIKEPKKYKQMDVCLTTSQFELY